jgi:hypothetical protein
VFLTLIREPKDKNDLTVFASIIVKKYLFLVQEVFVPMNPTFPSENKKFPQ